MQDKIVLFDIDYTLFDVGKYKKLVFSKLQDLLPEKVEIFNLAQISYEKVREQGIFTPTVFTGIFLKNISVDIDRDILTRVWTDPEILSQCIYEETFSVLENLKKQVLIGIFSSGHEPLQRAKIATISHLLEDRNIHIYPIKENKLEEVISEYKDKKIYLIDDFLEILQKAKGLNKNIISIWIKRGKFAEITTVKFKPDHVMYNLKGLFPLIV